MSNPTVHLSLPSGEVKPFPKGVTGNLVASSIGKKLSEDALCIKVNGVLKDLSFSIERDAKVEIITFDSDEGGQIYWHSSSHLMAQAIEELFPGTKFGTGPATENGFYYDLDSPRSLVEDDLREIEKRMQEIAKRDLEIEREELSREQAIEYFTTKRVDPYKVEILEKSLRNENKVSIYHQGDFSDLCSGPHLPRTSKLKAFKLTGISSSYWRGDVNRKRMQRVYGISFPSSKLLEAHFHRIEEAKKRDHRRIGTSLGLFMFSSLVGSGLPIWLPKGAVIRTELQNFLTEQQTRQGYKQVYTPHVGSVELYQKSGHYPYYKESQFPPLTFEDEEGKQTSYLLKPMNCPHHHQIYASSIRSYRDLPIRLAEFGTVYRYEQSGEINGLLRARSFTQDDAHIYCEVDQLESEICSVIELTSTVFDVLGFSDIQIRLSFRDKENKKKYGGDDKIWERSQEDIKQAAEKMKLKYFIGTGEASFYGPKIDFIVSDAIGRKWQLGTVQVDYVMPERFDLKYINSNGKPERPIIIHRAPFGSIERMAAILIENFEGNFPLWLSPVQVVVIPISDEFKKFADEVAAELKALNIRLEVDNRKEKISKKIRDAEAEKIPYMVVVGQKEQDSKTVSVRRKFLREITSMSIESLSSMLTEEIITKKNNFSDMKVKNAFENK